MKEYKPPRRTWKVAPLPKAAGATSPAPVNADTLSLSQSAQPAPEATQWPTLGWIEIRNQPPVRLTRPTTTGSLKVPVGNLELGVPFASRFARSTKNDNGERWTYVLTPWASVHAFAVYKDVIVEAEIPAYVLPTIQRVYFGVTGGAQ